MMTFIDLPSLACGRYEGDAHLYLIAAALCGYSNVLVSWGNMIFSLIRAGTVYIRIINRGGIGKYKRGTNSILFEVQDIPK